MAASIQRTLPGAPARVHSVWEVCQRVRAVLERDDLLPDLWVRGEVSNAKLAPSGHVYFTLKDAEAQVACVVWNGRERLRFEVRDGLQVLVHGRVAMYAARGQVQVVAEEVQPDGRGALHLAFEQMKQRLEAEGLFRAERKRPLPAVPRRIAVVTSLQGAALRDVLRVLAARWPLAEVVVKPVRVQGDGAEMEIAAALRLVARSAACDVAIVGRGGGSLEDLWAFNTETVARAIAACPVPVVSAVGHETDTTIADFVADLRAATPTQAAQLVAPDRPEVLHRLEVLARRLRQPAARLLEQHARRLAELEARAALRRPQRLLESWAQKLDEDTFRLARAAGARLRVAEERLALAASLLDSYSPLRTLQRGYAIVAVQGRAARSAAELPPGTRAQVRLADGAVEVVVQDG